MLMPRISVIIPNYNHAVFLPQRIESILNQHVRDIEVIILDDCSTDSSREIITRYAQSDSRITTHFNTTNSGSPFRQWNKGVEMAQAPLVWIAESDDYAHLDFLTHLLPLIENQPGVTMAYAQSISVSDTGKRQKSWLPFMQALDANLWHRDFVMPGNEAIRRFFLFRNIIPNVSSCIFRRSAYQQAGGAPLGYRVNGDWALYVSMLHNHQLAFCAKELNFFRQHSQSVTKTVINKGVNAEEISRVLRCIASFDFVTENDKRKAVNEFTNWWKTESGRWYVKIPFWRNARIFVNLSAVSFAAMWRQNKQKSIGIFYHNLRKNG